MDNSMLRLYEDFHPETQLLKDDAAEILRVKLPGFTKYQVRVRLDSNGNLKITGERPIVNNKWSRFQLNFRVPENSKTDGISAKFESEILNVVIPNKKITSPTVSTTTSLLPPPPSIPDAKQPEPEPRKQQEEAAFNNRPSSRADEISNDYNGAGGSLGKKISQPTSPTSTDRFPSPVPNNHHNGDDSKDDEQQDSNAKMKYMDDEIHPRDRESKSRNIGYENFGSLGATKRNGQRKLLIVNIAVAALVLVGVGMYVFFQT